MADATPEKELNTQAPEGSATETSAGDTQGETTSPNTEDRYQEAQRELSIKGDRIKAYETTMVDLARKDPEMIHGVNDFKLREKLSQEVHGVSYDDLKARKELEGKKDDPDYESKKKILELEQRLTQKEKADQKKQASEFFKAKGIIDSEYDENFQKVQANIRKLEPGFVKDNYSEALDIAYRMSFGDNGADLKESAAVSDALAATPGGTSVPQDRPSGKKVSGADVKFLQGIGATKTLKKLTS